MAWTTPHYSPDEVNAAGRVLVSKPTDWETYEEALTIINNWRSSHSFPLNTFQVTLRRKAKQIDHSSLVAQRIKRLPSIMHKLERIPSLKLSQMQDIGGCRAIVKTPKDVEKLTDLYRRGDLKHKWVKTDDYIGRPKASGYRGVHLVYRYFSDKSTTYNERKIEIQLRTPLQHAWATAVETVGTFLRQALKSSQGEEGWLRFFSLMGTAIALREKTQPVPGTPADKKELTGELRHYSKSLDVARRLRTYGEALQTLGSPKQNAHYYLLSLDPGAGQVTVTGYRSNEMQSAAADYLATERAIGQTPGAEAVLVSVESLASLQRAFPNYFLDTSVFIEEVRRAIGT